VLGALYALEGLLFGRASDGGNGVGKFFFCWLRKPKAFLDSLRTSRWEALSLAFVSASEDGRGKD
jgi:hypothetical protein